MPDHVVEVFELGNVTQEQNGTVTVNVFLTRDRSLHVIFLPPITEKMEWTTSVVEMDENVQTRTLLKVEGENSLQDGIKFLRGFLMLHQLVSRRQLSTVEKDIARARAVVRRGAAIKWLRKEA